MFIFSPVLLKLTATQAIYLPLQQTLPRTYYSERAILFLYNNIIYFRTEKKGNKKSPFRACVKLVGGTGFEPVTPVV